MTRDKYIIKHYIFILNDLSRDQFVCILNSLNSKQARIILDILHNLTYNPDIGLSNKQKLQLKPHKLAIEELLSSKISLNKKRTKLIPSNVNLIIKSLKIISKIDDIHQIVYG